MSDLPDWEIASSDSRFSLRPPARHWHKRRRKMMTILNPGLKKAGLNILLLSLCLFCAVEVAAQKRQAIIILRSPGGGASVTQCDGVAEINYQLAVDVKLKNKEEVRIASNVTPSGDSTFVSRDEYEKMRKAKIKDLFALRWG